MMSSPVPRRTVLLGGLAAVAGCSAGPGSGRQETLGIASGDRTTVYFEYARQLAMRLTPGSAGVRARVDVTPGSVENLNLLAAGQDRLALVAADAAANVLLAQQIPLSLTMQALARLYDDYIHLVVQETSPIKTISDLRGHRVSIGADRSGVELVAERVLLTAGLQISELKVQYLSLDAAIQALQASMIDAFFWSGGIPTDNVARLAKETPIRLVPLGGLIDRIRALYGPYYRAATVPQGTYHSLHPKPVFTLALANYLLTTSALEEKIARRVTEIVIKDRDTIGAAVPPAELIDARSAIQTGQIPLHPGALEYYRSIKP